MSTKDMPNIIVNKFAKRQVEDRGPFGRLDAREWARLVHGGPWPAVAKYRDNPPAVQVDIAIYASTILGADNDLPKEEGNYEIISINAAPVDNNGEAEPMHPDTLLANHFDLDGGTPTNLTAEAFEAKLRISVLYWKDKSMCTHRSYFTGSCEELVNIVALHFENQTPGDRDGRFTVRVPPKGFYSGVALLQEGDQLEGEYAPRRAGEAPRKAVRLNRWREEGQ